jgi:hypothetical protein
MTVQTTNRETGKVLAAGVSGAILGAVSGALIGYSIFGGQGALVGALIVGLYMGLAEAITDARRQPGELKPQWHRIVGTTIVGAALGALLGVFIENSVLLGLIMGGVTGLAGLAVRKLLLGLVMGLVIGVGAQSLFSDPSPAFIGGSVVLVYRLLLLLFFRDSAPVTLAGEHVPATDARYVVPFEAHTKIIGTGFMEQIARDSDGTFTRNKQDIGIVATLDDLAGPNFDPAKVDPLIREFYEHTTRFKLSIEPDWNPFIKPFFWFFKTFIAQRIGQANLPFNTEEAQRGMVSYVDTIDYESKDGQSGHIETLRGWIRAYEDSGDAIYVGIYTVVRENDVGYVSVGFPLPEANFTATLMPFNNRETGLLLKTHDTGSSFTGHYLTDIDDENGSLTILKLPTMGEQIDVFVREEHLKTEHRFYFGEYRFLTLHYTIERKQEANSV